MSTDEANNIYSVAVSDGSVLSNFVTHGEHAEVRVRTRYRASPKGDKARYGTKSNEMKPLPAGEHTFDIRPPAPDNAEVFLDLRSPAKAEIDLAYIEGTVRFEYGEATLQRGAADLQIGKVRGSFVVIEIRVDWAGAFDPAYVEYDDGSGRKPLQKGLTGIRSKEPIKLFLSLGDCHRLDLRWRWL